MFLLRGGLRAPGRGPPRHAGGAPTAPLPRAARRAPAPAPAAAAGAGAGAAPGPDAGGARGAAGSTHQLDTIDVEWAAFPKPGLGCFYRPCAPASAPPLAAGAAALPGARAAALAVGLAPAPADGAWPAAAASQWDAPAGDACSPLLRVAEAFVIVFAAEPLAADSEAIYVICHEGADGLPCHTVVAFESEEDAERYCGLLEASMDAWYRPRLQALPTWELDAFCRDHGYPCRLEPRGSLLMPPDASAPMTDWERTWRLRQGTGFSVLPEEPQVHRDAALGRSQQQQQQQQRQQQQGATPPPQQQQQQQQEEEKQQQQQQQRRQRRQHQQQHQRQAGAASWPEPQPRAEAGGGAGPAA